MPKTFEMLRDKYIVFFYEDEQIRNFVQTICKTSTIQYVFLKLRDLPTYKLSKKLLTSCKRQNNDYLLQMNDQKGLRHYNREYKQSGKDSYRKVISIWTSKVLLIHKIIQENPFQTNQFAWVDVSISRISKWKIVQKA